MPRSLHPRVCETLIVPQEVDFRQEPGPPARAKDIIDTTYVTPGWHRRSCTAVGDPMCPKRSSASCANEQFSSSMDSELCTLGRRSGENLVSNVKSIF